MERAVQPLGSPVAHPEKSEAIIEDAHRRTRRRRLGLAFAAVGVAVVIAVSDPSGGSEGGPLGDAPPPSQASTGSQGPGPSSGELSGLVPADAELPGLAPDYACSAYTKRWAHDVYNPRWNELMEQGVRLTGQNADRLLPHPPHDICAPEPRSAEGPTLPDGRVLTPVQPAYAGPEIAHASDSEPAE